MTDVVGQGYADPSDVTDDDGDEDATVDPASAGNSSRIPVPGATRDPNAGLTDAQRQARAQAEMDLALPQTKAFLDTISVTEGTQKHGYNTAYGGGYIPDLSKFPGIGKHTPSGRYQIIGDTFSKAQKALGLPDFGPHSQDLAGAWLLHQTAILPYLKIGDFNGALDPASAQWSTLPMDETGKINDKNNGQIPKDYTTVFNTYRNNLKRYAPNAK